jgi:hypothetical protein
VIVTWTGWSEGAGLGSTASGVTAPVNVGPVTTGAGVGTAPVRRFLTCVVLLAVMVRVLAWQTHKAEATDDEFEEYRKRMMLAYRFRPNPMVRVVSGYVCIAGFHLSRHRLRSPCLEVWLVRLQCFRTILGEPTTELNHRIYLYSEGF